MISIQPKQSPAKNPVTGQPFVATQATIIGTRETDGSIGSGQFVFFDAGGNRLPNGTIPYAPAQSAASVATNIKTLLSEQTALTGEDTGAYWERCAKSLLPLCHGCQLA